MACFSDHVDLPKGAAPAADTTVLFLMSSHAWGAEGARTRSPSSSPLPAQRKLCKPFEAPSHTLNKLFWKFDGQKSEAPKLLNDFLEFFFYSS